jgi:hypothetical protein
LLVDWNQKPEFFEFTRGRFVSDEAAQVACRRVHFDMNELAKTAALSIGAKRCVDVEKCPDGLYNKAFIFTLEDGRQIVGKVPDPIAGLPHFTTASEVATLDFVCISPSLECYKTFANMSSVATKCFAPPSSSSLRMEFKE